jgi:ribose transport system permease protein
VSGHVSPPADHADKARTWLQRIADLRAWLFLAALILGFEMWSRVSFGGTFLFNPFNITVHRDLRGGPAAAGDGADLRHHLGRDRPVDGLHHGAGGRGRGACDQLGHAGMGMPMAVLFGGLVAVAVAMIPGFINGLLVSRLRVPPFIGTLGMFGVARGVAFLLAGGTTVPVQNSFFATLGNGRFFGVPWIVIVTAVFVLVMHYLLSQTRFGQHNYAIGANVQAARRAGINIKSHLCGFTSCRGFARGWRGALRGAVQCGRGAGGRALLLDSVAAVVIGGASLFGGSGTILGTVAGAFVIAVIQYGLVFINVEPFWQFISVGVVIIISVLIDQAQRRFSGGRQSE